MFRALELLLCLVLALSSGLTLRMSGPKTVAIFGGTGGVGRECVYQALKEGHNVVVLARDPSKMLTPERVAGSGGSLLTDPKLHVIQGNVCEAADVNKVYQYIASSSAPQVQGTIVALGGKTKDVGKTMLTDGTSNIIKAIKANNGGKRVAVVTSIGAGDSESQAPLVFKVRLMQGVTNAAHHIAPQALSLRKLGQTFVYAKRASLLCPCRPLPSHITPPRPRPKSLGSHVHRDEVHIRGQEPPGEAVHRGAGARQRP